MENRYDVLLNGTAVGEVTVRKEGLYYHFSCRCKLEGDMCRLYVSICDKEEKLGVLIPMDGGFGLDTKIPCKRLGEGNAEFRIVPDKPVLKGQFIPIYPEEPFAYIERLKNAYLARQNGPIGSLLQEKAGP